MPDALALASDEDEEAQRLKISVSVIFSLTGENMANAKLSPEATLFELGEVVAVAAERAQRAAFPLCPRFFLDGMELRRPRETLQALGIGDGAQLMADMFPVVVTASDDGTAKLWNAETGECEKTLRGHEGPVNAATFAPDGRFVATASEDKTARLWTSATGKCWRTLSGHKDTVNAVCFSPDGKQLVSTSHDTTAKVWVPKNGNLSFTLEGHKAPVVSAVFDADGETVMTMSQDGEVKTWNSKSGVCLRTTQQLAQTYSTSYAPDGLSVVIAPGDQHAQILNVSTNECVMELHGHRGTVLAASFGPAAGPLFRNTRGRTRTDMSGTTTTSGGRSLSPLASPLQRDTMQELLAAELKDEAAN